MTPSLLALAALLSGLLGPARAAEEEAPPPEGPPEQEPPEEEDPLAPYRLPLATLSDRAIGSTSRAMRFNWRNSPVQVGLVGDHLFELNNFNSLRGGLQVRLPTRALIFEASFSRVEVWGSASTRMLSLTPYRQPGRPDRWELDLLVALPLAEGIVTARPRFLPSTQLVLHAFAGLRYGIYPQGFRELKTGQVLAALWSPALTTEELANLEGERLGGMEVDSGRYGLMLGLGNDLYLRQGLYLSPRLLLAVPVLAPASGTDLLWWADLSLALGVAF